MLDINKYTLDNMEEFKIACLKDLELDMHKNSSELFDMVVEKLADENSETRLMSIYIFMEVLREYIKKNLNS